MKTVFCIPTAMLMLIAVALQVECHAQEQPIQAEVWRKIESANGKIGAIEATWRAVMTTPSHQPLPKQKEEEILARVKSKAEQEGLTSQEVSRRVQIQKETLRLVEKGQTTTSLLHFVRVGQTIKCDVTVVEAQNGIIDFFDGKNSVSIETEVNGEPRSPQGNVMRDTSSILSYSAPTWQSARLLTGMSLSQEYSSYNPSFKSSNSVAKLIEDKLILERQVLPKQTGVGIEYPALLRMILTSDYRPSLYESRNTLDKSAQAGLVGRVLISGYKSYPSGIQFPSQITVDTGAYKIEYSLQKAKFNDAVDPSLTQMPPNTLIADSRFGFGAKTVVYRMKDGVLLSDSQVLKLLGDKPKDVVALQAAHAEAEEGAMEKTTRGTPLTMFLGLGLLGIGAAMWKKSGCKR